MSEIQRESPTEVILLEAIARLYKIGHDDCEIGHNLIREGVDHLQGALLKRGIRYDQIRDQLKTARKFIDRQIAEFEKDFMS